MRATTDRLASGRRCARSGVRWLAAGLPAIACAQQTTLVDNEAVLRAWTVQREAAYAFRTLPVVEVPLSGGAAGAENAPGLRFSAMAEARHVSSTASRLQSPWREGSFGRLLIQGQWYAVSDTSIQSWAIGNATLTNDRALHSQSNGLLNSFQVGRSTQAWLLMAGDVQPQFSTLGTALSLRGMLAQVAGPGSVLSVTAGTLAHSWQGLWGETVRPTYLRDAAALKYEYWPDARLSVFAAAQGFQDRRSSVEPGRVAEPPVRATSVTAGARYADMLPSGLQRDLAGEWGRSRARADGLPWQRGQARVLDGSLQWGGAGLRAGWHKIDPGFVSLSTQLVAGLNEVYLAGDWRPLQPLGLSADIRTLRHTVGAAVGDRIETAERRSDAATLLAQLSLARWIAGLSADASHYRVDTDTPSIGGAPAGESSQRYDRLNLNYAVGGWSTGLGALRLTSRDRFMVDAASTTDGWDARLGAAFLHSGSGGQGWFNAVFARQRQSRDGAPQHRLRQAQAWAGWQLGDRWSATAAIGETRLAQDLGGLSTRLRQLSLDARMALAPNASIAGFVRVERSDSETGALRYRTSQGGVQLAVRY